MAAKIETGEVEQSDILRIADLLGGPATFKRPLANALDAHEMIVHGFPGTVLTKLVANVLLFQRPDAFEKAIGISHRTFQRRKADVTPKTLSSEQSGRAWKFAEILSKATTVLGSQNEAEQWLERPAIGLNRRRPIDLLSTTAGAELVEQYLERIEFGVYA
jgi:putative toxin-antitoxin system antitoxin component (TIGR02293 family)